METKIKGLPQLAAAEGDSLPSTLPRSIQPHRRLTFARCRQHPTHLNECAQGQGVEDLVARPEQQPAVGARVLFEDLRGNGNRATRQREEAARRQGTMELHGSTVPGRGGCLSQAAALVSSEQQPLWQKTIDVAGPKVHGPRHRSTPVLARVDAFFMGMVPKPTASAANNTFTPHEHRSLCDFS